MGEPFWIAHRLLFIESKYGKKLNWYRSGLKIDGQAGRQAGRQTDRQTGRQIDRHKIKMQ